MFIYPTRLVKIKVLTYQTLVKMWSSKNFYSLVSMYIGIVSLQKVCCYLINLQLDIRTLLLLLLLSRFSRVWLCATPETAAHQAPPSLGFSRQEHWSGLPFSSPVHESEKWKWSHSVVSDPQRPHGLQPSRLLCPWDFPGKSTGMGYHTYPTT